MWFGEAITALAAAIALNALVGRLAFSKLAVVRFVAVGAVVGIGLCVHLYGDYAAGIETIAGLLIYALGCELYLFLFTLAMASISANIVRRLAHEPLNDQQLNGMYDGRSMVEMRIDRLRDKGLLSEVTGRLGVTTRGRRLAFAFTRLQTLLGRY